MRGGRSLTAKPGRSWCGGGAASQRLLPERITQLRNGMWWIWDDRLQAECKRNPVTVSHGNNEASCIHQAHETRFTQQVLDDGAGGIDGRRSIRCFRTLGNRVHLRQRRARFDEPEPAATNSKTDSSASSTIQPERRGNGQRRSIRGAQAILWRQIQDFRWRQAVQADLVVTFVEVFFGAASPGADKIIIEGRADSRADQRNQSR